MISILVRNIESSLLKYNLYPVVPASIVDSFMLKVLGIYPILFDSVLFLVNG